MKRDTGHQLVLDFMQKFGMVRQDFAAWVGVTPQAVKLWEDRKRDVPLTTRRVLKLVSNYPHLKKEFAS